MHDEIARLLAEENMDDDTALRDGLMRIQQTATSVRPMPSPELAALLGERRRSTAYRHRGMITALAVVVALGGTATAAAASPGVRSVAHQVVTTVIGTVLPGVAHPPAPAPVGNNTKPTTAPLHTPSPGSHATPSDHPTSTDHPNSTDHPSNGNSKSENNDSSRTPSPGNDHATSAPVPPHSPNKP